MRLGADPPDVPGAAAMALRMVELVGEGQDDPDGGGGDDPAAGLIRVELAEACSAKVAARAVDALRALARDARAGRRGVPAEAWRGALRAARPLVRAAAELGEVEAAAAVVGDLGLEGLRADAEAWLVWAGMATGGDRLEARRVVNAVGESLREAVRAQIPNPNPPNPRPARRAAAQSAAFSAPPAERKSAPPQWPPPPHFRSIYISVVKMFLSWKVPAPCCGPVAAAGWAPRRGPRRGRLLRLTTVGMVAQGWHLCREAYDVG
jgi:hypothetical protein